ncbi:hypothetical protein MRB53_016249 [Persea americana]|uniref:Uncharacterized protein n=1 Tax=Persea americana TaxID=3435 RepID=A0ACC2M1P9_PERAE|nr:hypothetical protein MRB53_016249 [Persea americana]
MRWGGSALARSEFELAAEQKSRFEGKKMTVKDARRRGGRSKPWIKEWRLAMGSAGVNDPLVLFFGNVRPTYANLKDQICLCSYFISKTKRAKHTIGVDRVKDRSCRDPILSISSYTRSTTGRDSNP